MAWWNKKKKTMTKATRDLSEKIEAIQSHQDMSTLTNALYDILSTIDTRLIELEKKVNERK